MLSELMLNAILIGTGATMFMDFVALGQKHLLSQQTLDYALVGRWLGHMRRGQFIHRPISASDPIRGEKLLGWGLHYLIGILFAGIFLAIMDESWIKNPTLLPAILFGILTVLAPFLIMQPGLGAGLAARRAPKPTVARAKSIFAHLVFGVGLWITALGFAGIVQ